MSHLLAYALGFFTAPLCLLAADATRILRSTIRDTRRLCRRVTQWRRYPRIAWSCFVAQCHAWYWEYYFEVEE